MTDLFTIRDATRAARARLSDDTISTRVKQGKIQIVRVVYPTKRSSTITPVSDWMPLNEVEAALAAL